MSDRRAERRKALAEALARHALPALTGNLWVPAWTVRPGSYKAVAPLADAMPLWLLLHSRNCDDYRPCYASREALGVAIGRSRDTVARQLQRLRRASLVFEVRRPADRKTRRRRPPARWALDPFAAEVWRDEVEVSLARVAEEDGHDARWLARSLTSLDAFDRRSRLLGARIVEDMLIQPSRRRRKRKRKRARAITQDCPRGGIYPTGEVEGDAPVDADSRLSALPEPERDTTWRAFRPGNRPESTRKLNGRNGSEGATANDGSRLCGCGTRIPPNATRCATCEAVREGQPARE